MKASRGKAMDSKVVVIYDPDKTPFSRAFSKVYKILFPDLYFDLPIIETLQSITEETILILPLFSLSPGRYFERIGPIFCLNNKFPRKVIALLFKEREKDGKSALKTLADLIPCCILEFPFELEQINSEIQYFSKDTPCQWKIDGAKAIIANYCRTFLGDRKNENELIKEAYNDLNVRISMEDMARAKLEHDIWKLLTCDSYYGFDENKKANLEKYLKENDEESRKQDYADCLKGLISDRRAGKNPINVLLIDNDPDPFRKTLMWLKDIFNYNISLIRRDEAISELFEGLQKLERSEIRVQEYRVEVENLDDQNRANKKRVDEFDLILLDLDLGKNVPKGQLFLQEFLKTIPEIPVFILSSSEDPNVIQENLDLGADGYVPKSRMLTLGNKINKYFNDKLGELVFCIKDAGLRKNLIGNLRKWNFNRNLLWFADKCYHMVNHSFNHSENDWRIANRILPPILKYLKGKEDPISDEDLYAFCMAVWLHDIGHKGNERFGEAHEIRDLHGLISGELILQKPELYGVYGFEGASYYTGVTFGIGGLSITTPKSILKRAIGQKKCSLEEKIALISIYHKSNFPVIEEDIEKIRGKNKLIPQDCYDYSSGEPQVICLNDFIDFENNKKIAHLTALFRFIDGIDIRKNRVGNLMEREIKETAKNNDLAFQQDKLLKEVQKILARIEDRRIIREIKKVFYDDYEIEIKGNDHGISPGLENAQNKLIDQYRHIVDWGDFIILRNYIRFIAVQVGHFNLHNAIEDIRIDHTNSDALPEKAIFKIIYITSKPKEYLLAEGEYKDIIVREWRDLIGRNIRDHLLGQEVGGIIKEGYVRRELNSCREFLKDWIDLDNCKISIENKEWEKAFEERSDKKAS